MCYLHGTWSLQIHFSNPKVNLASHAFSDSDWAGCLSDRLSVSGYVWFFYGGPIAHTFKKQVMHALSTTKAKYMALSGCVQEGLWLKFFICSLHQSLSVSLYVHADNTAIISLAIMPSNHSNAHHINTCFHFIHEHVDHKVFELFWTSIFHNIADILTKPLECHIFAKHCVVLFLVLC